MTLYEMLVPLATTPVLWVALLLFIGFEYKLMIFARSMGDVLDTHLYYTPDEVYATLDKYGAKGCRNYIANAKSWDALFPLVYGCLLVLLLVHISSSPWSPGSWLQPLHAGRA